MTDESSSSTTPRVPTGGVAASKASPATTKSAPVTITLDHPRLLETDPEAIRIFLRTYDQYANEVRSRAQQLGSSSSSTEPVRPVDLKFCVDVEFLESSIALGFITDAPDYKSLTDEQVRNFLSKRAEESKEVVTLEKLDGIVSRELRTNMRNTNAAARMQDLFTNYHTILVRNGLKWIIKDNQKVAVYHVLSAIRPNSLKERLESDLAFSHHDLRKDFLGFLKHAIRLAEAFQIVDSGPTNKKNKATDTGNSNRANKSRSGNQSDKEGTKKFNSGKKAEDLPVCLWPPHAERGIRHYLKDCRACPDEEKKRILQDRAAEKAKDGPSKSTRSQSASSQGSATSSGTPQRPTTGRLQQHPITISSGPSCAIIVSDGNVSVQGTGRCDDGSDETIASPRIAEKAVLKGIGRFEAITPVTVQVALSSSADPETFTFSRKWIAPRIVMELSAGRLALHNVSFLVADAHLSCEDILLGYPVLQHLGIDSRTLLERNRRVLDGTDCSPAAHPSISNHEGSLGRLLIARLQRVKQSVQSKTDESGTINLNRPRANYFDHKSDLDPFPNPNLVDMDSAPSASINNIDILAMIYRAKQNGILPKPLDDLTKIVWSHAHVFDTRFSATPAKVPPLKIELTGDARPIRVKLRNYSQSQRNFMTNLTNELMQYNLIYPNPSSKWACAPLLVPKSGPAEWRFTVDLRPINQYTIRHQLIMPNVEEELTKTAGSTVYASVDFTHSYWQLPLHKDSQECQSFVTPDNVFTPTRVPHGTTNAVLHLQSFLSTKVPLDVKQRMLLWVDDCLFHAPTVKDLVLCLNSFFHFCSDFNLRLHPKKCVLYATSVKWCGRIISANGIRHDPSNLQGLLDLDRPTTDGQLQQFVCAMQWLRSSIPQFQRLIQPLHDFLELVYVKVGGKRTKRAVSSVNLNSLGWTDAHSSAFNDCKNAILNRTTLAHRDSTKRLCLYTDASESHWSGILTQVPYAQLHLPHADQDHEPLAFHSGRFSGAQVAWSTIEKEAFSVLATTERSHWLASTPAGFDLFTDHNNLVFIFDPCAVVPNINQTTIRKVLRWAVRLSTYNYVCFHIKGDDNIWADLLTRWSIPLTIRRLVSIPPLPTTFQDFVWPTADTIRESQRAHPPPPQGFICVDGLYRLSNHGPIWIPDDDAILQLRLSIIAHTGAAGHRGTEATEQALSQRFTWSTLSEDIHLFTKSCIHCLSTTGGETVPRPFGPAFHGTKPNDLVQFDYIELGKSTTGEKHVLMLRDDHSGYCWFYPSVDQTAQSTANALLDWCAAFGPQHSAFMSDGPTHFKNETIRLLTKGLHSRHHFTLPYCPWSNGAVERLGRELLRISRALLSKTQFPKEEWPQLPPIFQSAINNSPSPARNNIAPITAFTGAAPSRPIDTFIRTTDSSVVTLTDIQRERALHVDSLIKYMDQLHPMIHSQLQKNRSQSRSVRSRGELANFTEGDYVLVAREDFFENEKLCLRWRGPRRVIKALNDYVFKVEDLRNGETEDIHGTRLKFYADDSLDARVILSHVLASETGMPVSRLIKLVDDDGTLCVQVRWKGLSPSDDTLEPISRVHEDVPQLFLKLLDRKNTPADLRQRVRDELGL